MLIYNPTLNIVAAVVFGVLRTKHNAVRVYVKRVHRGVVLYALIYGRTPSIVERAITPVVPENLVVRVHV